MVKIEENIALAPYTTFKVGGPAKHFCRVSDVSELREALKMARESGWAIFILGGGSNLIIGDRGFKGLVIKIELRDIQVTDGTIICGAGVPLGALVNTAAQSGLSGLEWAAGIPGTVGGAVRGNAGAFGGETKDIIDQVISINPATGNETKHDNKQCGFEYRGSIFKKNDEIIVEARIKLKKGVKSKISQEIHDHINYRTQRHPHEYPSAGSVFKNVPADELPDKARLDFADVIKTDPFPVVPAAAIIARAGLAGYKIGSAQVSSKHTNYIVNVDHATAGDIIKLIKHIQKIVKQKYNIALIPEQQIIGV